MFSQGSNQNQDTKGKWKLEKGSPNWDKRLGSVLSPRETAGVPARAESLYVEKKI